MPSTFSPVLRLNYQEPGDSLNTWGLVLNTGVFQLLEDAVAKRVAFSLSGSKTLTTANGATDEARCAFLDVTSGTGGTVTIPSVAKIYFVRNGATGDVMVTTGAGAVATVKPTELSCAISDGANVYPLGVGSQSFKAYADGLAFNAVDLPGQGPGTTGAVIMSDGATASWAQLVVGDVDGAAPLDAPSFTGGVTVAGGATIDGGSTLNGASRAAGSFVVEGLDSFNVAAISGTTIDLTQGPGFTKSISGNTTFDFSGSLPDDGVAFFVKLTITSGAVDTWPASVDFEHGTKPVLGNGTHYLGFITLDSGTQWLMKVVGRNVL